MDRQDPREVRRFRLTLAYDGTRYDGWQRQGNTENTIQARVEALLSRALGMPAEVHGCGRTDAGVHAHMQVCHFDAPAGTDPVRLLRELRAYLPEDIAASGLEPADARFHARLSCRAKTYVYRINTGEVRDVFRRRYELFLPGALDEAAMAEAAALLTGRHDWRAFTNNHRTKKSTVRTVTELCLDREGGRLSLWFTGDGFLYNMVRIMTGTLLEVGQGRRRPEEMPALLASLDRRRTGPAAPACGLTLWEVFY